MKRILAALLCVVSSLSSIEMSLAALRATTGNLPGRESTLTVCASNSLNAGCDYTATGAADQGTINTAIQNCGNPNQSVFTATISGTTATVSSIQTGTIAVGEVVTGSGVSANTHITASLGGGQWTIAPSQTVSTATSMSGYDPGSGNGCKVLLRDGTYNLTGSIILDRSNVTLEGESSGFWGAYQTNFQGGGSTPTGAISTANVKLYATTNGFDVIKEMTANTPDTGETRHRNLTYRNLYIVGNGTNPSTNYNNTPNCMNLQAGTDNVHVENMFMHRCQTGIVIADDAPTISKVSIQDVSGPGISVQGWSYVRISDCIIWDAATGIWLNNNYGDLISNCTIGDIIFKGIDVGANRVAITGNFFGPIDQGAVHLYGNASGITVTGNIFDFNDGLNGGDTRTEPAVWLQSAANSIVSNNTFYPKSGGEPAGIYAIDPSGCNNCSIFNNQIAGSWNNGSVTKINTPGSGTMVGFNQGDLTNGAPTPQSTVAALPTCGTSNKGQINTVTDATSPSYGASLTGGGAVVTIALCNGSGWVAH